jgi:hypothetical protein
MPVESSKAGFVAESKELIQLSVTLAIFFSSAIYVLNQASGKTGLNSAGALIWGIAIAVQVVNYFLIQWASQSITPRWFAWIKGSLVAGVLSFVIPLFIIGLYYNKALPNPAIWPFIVSMSMTIFLPLITFLIIEYCLVWVMILEVWSLWRRHGSPSESSTPSSAPSEKMF